MITYVYTYVFSRTEDISISLSPPSLSLLPPPPLSLFLPQELKFARQALYSCTINYFFILG